MHKARAACAYLFRLSDARHPGAHAGLLEGFDGTGVHARALRLFLNEEVNASFWLFSFLIFWSIMCPDDGGFPFFFQLKVLYWRVRCGREIAVWGK